ncbi:hypothetical protein J4434_03330 [Candidatus Woesearchaeota archaeon]|nr:hypothetical protein [Candidatus Woesearchaeota archaeon]
MIKMEGMHQLMLESLGYKVHDRLFDCSFRKLCKGAYEKLRFDLQEGELVYTGAAHNPKSREAKLPNITIIPNLPAHDSEKDEDVIVFGSSMGHYQQNHESPIMEIYEFKSAGAMVVDCEGDDNVNLFVANKGGKVIIPSGCNMTLYNFGAFPLQTLDFSNNYDGNNESHKHLQEESGPIMLVTYLPFKGAAIFEINPLWINREDSLGIKLWDVYNEQRFVVVPLTMTEHDQGKLTDKILNDNYIKAKFSEIGVTLREAKQSLSLEDITIDTPLEQLAVAMGKPLHHCFELM